MILFLISLIMICISSYLAMSLFEPRRYGAGIIYFLLIAFSQIVLTFEILSIFSAISALGVLILNVIFLGTSVFLWNKHDKPLYKPDFRNWFHRVKNALLKDKCLLILSLAFIFFIFVTVSLCLFVPVNSYDALSYHLGRVPFWISNGNLNHFIYPDVRIVIMPINSELLYTWVLIFLKDDWFLGIFSFLGYFLAVVSLYNFLGILGFCERKKLWSVFILSSMASILVEASSTETDIIIGGLILVSIFLYYYGIREDKKIPIYFSSLAYALAIGTKTPAIMSLVGSFVVFSVISYLYNKKDFYKPILVFAKFLALNFIVFASYNYVLNLLNYGNPFGNQSEMIIHSFFGGFKAFIANFIRYIFLMFDSSGFRYADYIGKYVQIWQNNIFSFLNIPFNLGVITPSQYGMNKDILESIMGCGLLGFLIFLPMLFYSVYKGLRYKFSKRSIILAAVAVMFFINLIILSFSIGFMLFSIRFVSFFVVLSSPVLVYSYMKRNNLFKFILIFFCVSYMAIISTHIWARPFFKLIDMYKEVNSIMALRERIRCSETLMFDDKMSTCLVKRELEKFPDRKNVAIFPDDSFRVYPVKMMENKGWNLDFLLLENLEKYNLDKYDFIVIMNKVQRSELLLHFNERKNDYHLVPGGIAFDKKRLVNCVYIDRYAFVVDAKNHNKPVSVICYIPKEYFAAKKFKLLTKIVEEGKSSDSIKNILIYKKEK